MTKKKQQEEAPIKKTPTKKSTIKKTTLAREKQKSALPPELCFWVCDGPVVDSLLNLKKALLYMSDKQFTFHTARAGNDFARWAREVVGCIGCAERLEKAKTRAGAIRAIAMCKKCVAKE